MARPTAGVPLVLLALAVAATVPLTRLALASEDEPAPATATDTDPEAASSALKGSLPAETAAAEQGIAAAPSDVPNDPIIPPVKRVIPVTPGLKAIKTSPKKPQAAEVTKAGDGSKPVEAKTETPKKK